MLLKECVSYNKVSTVQACAIIANDAMLCNAFPDVH